MKILLFLLPLFILPFRSLGQYLFTTLGTKDGLSSKSVTCILRDSRDFLWFGTQNGLNRFDGSSIKVYNWANGNYPTNYSETINDIVEMLNGDLLICVRNGLLRFSAENQQFSPTIASAALIEKYRTPGAAHMVMDPLGNAWMIYNREIFIYARDTLYLAEVIFPQLADLADSVYFSGLVTLDTIRHSVWFTTDHGLCMIDYTTGEYMSCMHNTKNLPVFQDKLAVTIGIDNKTGDIWWSDLSTSLMHYRVSDQTVHTNATLQKMYDVFPGKVTFIDSHGRVWASTWLGNLIVLDPSGQMTIFPEESIEPYPLYSGFVEDFVEDKYGNLWLATVSGVARMQISQAVRNIVDIPFEYAVINSFKRLDEGHLLIGSNAGLIIYKEQTETAELCKPISIPSGKNRIFTLELIDGEWWCGTGGGIQIFNPQTKTFRPLDVAPYTDEVADRSVAVLFRDNRDEIWFASWGRYVYRYDRSTGICTRFDGTEPHHGDIGITNCLAISEDRLGRIWIGNGEYGIRVYMNTQEGFRNINQQVELDNLVVNGFLDNPDSTLWVSTTGSGLYMIDLNGEVRMHLTTQHELSSNQVSSLARDDNGRIWFGTPETVHYINPGSYNVGKINFESQVAAGEDWPCILTDASLIYVSQKQRILTIDPALLEEKGKPQLPLISGINVFEEELPYSVIEKGLRLKYNQNFFRIDYSSPRHFEFPSIRYAYMLEGFNEDWVNNGRRLSAGFTNVPPGEYIFRVKASDENGAYYPEDRHFAVIIQPPFWQTKLFYGIIAIIAAYLLFLLYRFVLRRRAKKKSDQIIDYFANSVYSENSVDEICWDIARNCISQLGFMDCIVFMMNEERTHVVQRAAFGPRYPKGSDNLNPLRIAVGVGIIGTVAASGRALLVPDTSKDPRYVADDVFRLSEISVPIMHDQQVIGIIDSEHPEKNFFTPEHLKSLTTIASISAIKIAEAQTQMQAREHEMKLMEVNKLFAESQLKALRAQMNPHFVFNCLNSIQECIVTKKYKEASAYLNKFAKLFRLVLNNSGKLLITIDEEMEILKLYLDLEQMRFENGFEYTLQIDPSLESEDILMPSMFLQPFAENALWHGLMHKQGERLLTIRVDKVNDDIFSCSIDDNGIGRQKSAELKAKRIRGDQYASKGMQMNNERLEVLRRQGFHATLEVLDKPSVNGSSGTTVYIELSNNLN